MHLWGVVVIPLEAVAEALDAFPEWDENMRAEVFHAFDVAPTNFWEVKEEYFTSEAHAAWKRIRKYVLSNTSVNRWAVTLEESSGYESAPTKDEILKSLRRGAGMI